MRTRSWLTPPPPTVAIEIASRRVTVVALAAGAPSVSAYASEVWPAGTVTPSPAGINIAHADVVTATLTRALERAGLTATKRAALVVPDSAARLSLLHFDQAPSRAQDLDQLVRWQLRKSTPFPLEDAIVSQTQAVPDDDGLSVAAVVARKDVIAQYEAAVASVGIDTGLVDLSSLNVMNAIMAAGTGVTGDWLVVHLSAEATTLAILRGQSLMFYRHRTSIDDEPLGALVHQTAMYHEDRLGGRAFERVWLCGTDVATDDARWQISSRLGVPVESVDIRPAADLSDRASVTPEILDALAAPVGLLVRERRAAA